MGSRVGSAAFSSQSLDHAGAGEETLRALTEHQTLLALLAVAIILLLARAGGEIARRLGQPEVLGELLAGFLLGPSVFGAVLPNVRQGLLIDPGVSLVLSGLSWIGAVLLLLVAGMEVDLGILRKEAGPGLLSAAFAIVPSLIAGSVFAAFVLGRRPPDGVFLGIVMSVTAVSVVAKILMEREAMRREYAQVMLAAGVVTEVVVWLFVSVISAFHGSSPLLAGVRSTLFAIGFFVVVMTVGRRLVFWAMRRVRDATWVVSGQLSLVLVLTFAAAAATQALGLHALLGAFVVGVLLSQAPRANEELVRGVQSLTVGLFGPIFFVLAGMRVDIFRLGSVGAIAAVLLLLVVATAVKVGFSALGARLGGRHGWDAVLVGVGLNLKGGTDVVVAVIGTELGLLSIRAYTMYTVVGIVTVLFSPALMSWLERRTPPSKEEEERLAGEEAARRSYVPGVERVLVPVEKRLFPGMAATLVERLAASKEGEGQLFDITEMEICQDAERDPAVSAAQARDRLQEANTNKKVELTQKRVNPDNVLESVLTAASGYDLVAIGARPPKPDRLLTLGKLQDAIIHRAEADVLVMIDDAERFDCAMVRRILVPTNGLEYSMAAGDIAGALAQSCQATLVLFQVVHSDMDGRFWRERDQRRLIENAHHLLGELAFRVGRLGVRAEQKIVTAEHPGEAIVQELAREQYEMVVLGGIDRGQDDRPYLGRTIRTVLLKTKTPVTLLVSRDTANAR